MNKQQKGKERSAVQQTVLWAVRAVTAGAILGWVIKGWLFGYRVLLPTPWWQGVMAGSTVTFFITISLLIILVELSGKRKK